MKTIQVYVCPLSAIVQAEMIDFASRRDYQQYKREQIYGYRDQQIARHLDTSIDALDYAVTAHGKPYLRHSTLAFNHSHSQDDYALAISDRVVDIGVDIESLNRKIRFDALAQHAFHPDEYACWKALDEDVRYWFKVWTTKEAILKAHGMGIRLDLNTLNTHMHPTSDQGQIVDDRLGVFAYRCFDLGAAMLCVAWRSDIGCGQFILPKIQIFRP
ncbi:4'-phosphopantetheinyl transferase superfamily protein [Acinetobacter soli]|uniref:4'-phosphopantetheinyl transferase family protein n=1 Tax=Acinetobacter soli TaxID=487316 RepID=UPI0032B36B9D